MDPLARNVIKEKIIRDGLQIKIEISFAQEKGVAARGVLEHAPVLCNHVKW